MKKMLFTIMLLLIVFPNAALCNDKDEEAKASYQQGEKLFKDGNFEQAEKQFMEAYNLSEKQGILYNLAICNEKMEKIDKAIAYYQLYLEELPDAPDHDAVVKKIEELKHPENVTVAPASLDTKSSVADNNDQPESADKKISDNNSESENKNSNEKSTDSSSDSPAATTHLKIKDDTKLKARHKRKIAQAVIIASGAMVLASGGLTAIAAYNKYNNYKDTCAPDCSSDKADDVDHLSLAADIQMAVGVSVLAAGIIWAIVDASRFKKSSNENLSRLNTSFAVSFKQKGGAILFSRSF